jgi:hypothetical protein
MKKKLFTILIVFCLSFLFTIPIQSIQINDDFFYDPLEKIPGDMQKDTLPIRSTLPIIQQDISQSYQAKRNSIIVDLITPLNEGIYLDFLEDLVAFGPRVTSTDACQDAADYIYDQFLNMGLNTRIQEWEEGTLTGTNIEATIPGIDETSDDIYIICAHYDSVPGSPGADDDGSGTVGVLSAAYLMKNYEFNHTIKFVTFSGEEQGLHGSYHYVQESVDNNLDIAGVLNLDMIGYATSENSASSIRVYEGDFSQNLLDIATDITSEYDDIFDLEIIPSGYTWGSDHYYFWQAGYQALFFIESEFNDYYHSSQDIIDHMNIDYAVDVSQLAIATLAEMAEITINEAPETPSTPEGETHGKINVEYTYRAVSTDPQNDQLYYMFDWGDEEQSEWIGPYESGQSCEENHSYTKRGSYSIRVKAKDSNNYESGWSEPLPVSMPKFKGFQITLIEILNNYPNLFPILRLIFHI